MAINYSNQVSGLDIFCYVINHWVDISGWETRSLVFFVLPNSVRYVSTKRHLWQEGYVLL